MKQRSKLDRKLPARMKTGADQASVQHALAGAYLANRAEHVRNGENHHRECRQRHADGLPECKFRTFGRKTGSFEILYVSVQLRRSEEHTSELQSRVEISYA